MCLPPNHPHCCLLECWPSSNGQTAASVSAPPCGSPWRASLLECWASSNGQTAAWAGWAARYPPFLLLPLLLSLHPPRTLPRHLPPLATCGRSYSARVHASPRFSSCSTSAAPSCTPGTRDATEASAPPHPAARYVRETTAPDKAGRARARLPLIPRSCTPDGSRGTAAARSAPSGIPHTEPRRRRHRRQPPLQPAPAPVPVPPPPAAWRRRVGTTTPRGRRLASC